MIVYLQALFIISWHLEFKRSTRYFIVMETSIEELEFIVSAPGKVILFGEHSVVYKRAAVSTSIDRRLFVHVTSTKEKKISVNFPQINLKVVCNIEQFERIISEKCPLQDLNTSLSLDNPDSIDYTKYVESLKNDVKSLGINLNDLEDKNSAALLGFLFVMRGMCSVLSCKLIPFNLEVSSNLEVGAGSGSSAAFAVAITGAIYHYVKCIMSRCNNSKNMTVPVITDNVVINTYPSKSGFTLEEVKIINKWAFGIEKLMHGRPSGIDNTTCTFGSVVVTSQEQDRPGELVFRFLENIPRITILLIATGVSRNTSHLVTKVKELRDRNCAAVDAIFNAMEVIALEAFKTLDALGLANDDKLFNVLGGLMKLNHGLLRTIEVSHESLEHIVDVSNHFGLASKLTGAGGGGNAITLVPHDFCKSKLEELKKELGPSYKVIEVNIAEDGVRLENVK